MQRALGNRRTEQLLRAARSEPAAHAAMLPSSLRASIEALSGVSMEGVRVHHGSREPSRVNARAFTRGADIHLGPAQEDNLPHEAWHVVQQRQGRVAPTMRAHGTAINDDPALEREADVMGARAARGAAGGPAGRLATPRAGAGEVVQRRISVGGEDFAAGELHDRLRRPLPLSAAPAAARVDGYFPGILRGVLPAWDSLNRSFADWYEFAGAVNAVKDPYDEIWDVGATAGDLVERQQAAQQAIYAAPRAFEGLVTTLGFEHEFAQMHSGPLRGVSHLELSRSAETLRLTGLPWIIETDADDALELVSPPYVVPTVGGLPLPDADVVARMDEVLKAGLVGAVRGITGYLSWGNLTDLVAALGTSLRLNFGALANLDLAPENLSPRADLAALGGTRVTAGRLGEIKVGKSSKHSSGIDSQINLATDLRTLTFFEGLGTGKQDASIGLLLRVERALVTAMPPPRGASEALRLFYGHLHRKLAGLFAVPSQEAVRTWQASARDYLLNLQNGGGTPAPDLPETFAMDAMLSSVVKDVGPLWVKDHLMSLARGLLDDDDVALLAQDLQRRASLTLDMHGRISATVGRSEGYEALLDARIDGFNGDLQTAIGALERAFRALSLMGTWSALSDARPGSGFLEHDPRFIGARQDTYLDPRRVQQAGLWPGRRLHVIELRGGNGEILAEANRRARSG